MRLLTPSSVGDPGNFTVSVRCKDFDLNTNTFLNRSTYFAKALSAHKITHPPHGVFEVIEAPDIDVATFEYYLRCVAKNDANIDWDDSTALASASENGAKDADKDKFDSAMMQYCKGYYLATKLGDRAAANLIIDGLIDFSFDTHHIFCDKQVNWIIETLSDHSGLYRLAVDLWAFAAKYENFKERAEFGYLPHRFGKDVWLAKMKVEAVGKSKLVEDTFSYGFIKDSKKRYHGLNKLDLTEYDWDVEPWAALGMDESASSGDEMYMDEDGDEGIVSDDHADEGDGGGTTSENRDGEDSEGSDSQGSEEM